MALKILDNFVLGIAVLRFHHRIQELTPHDSLRSPARGSISRDPTTMVMAISPRNACTLARRYLKRRDGHHKKRFSHHPTSRDSSSSLHWAIRSSSPRDYTPRIKRAGRVG